DDTTHQSDGFHFLHDHVQQACYALMSEEKRAETHYHIGQLLLNNTPKSELTDNIFSIVNQLNLGKQLITNEKEIQQLIQLNLLAGQHAKDAAAFKPALNYLLIGKSKLRKNSWET